jgi:hypothetical protein
MKNKVEPCPLCSWPPEVVRIDPAKTDWFLYGCTRCGFYVEPQELNWNNPMKAKHSLNHVKKRWMALVEKIKHEKD